LVRREVFSVGVRGAVSWFTTSVVTVGREAAAGALLVVLVGCSATPGQAQADPAGLSEHGEKVEIPDSQPDPTPTTPEPDPSLGTSAAPDPELAVSNEVVCTGGMVAVNDDGESVVITDACDFVPINGNGAQVTMADADSVVVNGDDVVVTAGQIGTLIVNGSRVTVRATGYGSTPLNSGSGNSITTG
jgi:hypothetical protein